MNRCSFKSKYWNDLQEEREFECENITHSESDECIFHDKHFLDNEENHKIIVEAFHQKIEEYLLDINDKPLFCIGYHLFDINIQGKEFLKSVYFNQATIRGTLIISSNFISHLSFRDAEFSGEGNVDFRGAQFSGDGDVDFTGAKFSGDGDLDFKNVKFSGDGGVLFEGAEFSGKGYVIFNGAEFSGDGGVDFTGAMFLKKDRVLFAAAKFSGEGLVDFSRAEFPGEEDVIFEGAEFSGRVGVLFEGTEFSGKGNVDFRGAKFSGEEGVQFNYAKFSGEGDVIFEGAEFSGDGGVDFQEVKFLKKGNVYFHRTKFLKKGNVYFSDAKFSGEGNVYFSDAEFSGKGHVDFRGAEFSGEGNVYFSDANFSGEGSVYFSDANFSREGNVDFTRAKFLKEGGVHFIDTQFRKEGGMYFSDAKFFGVTYFIRCKFDCEVYFVRTNFISPNEVRFGTDNLSNVSFLNSDITRIFFDESSRFGHSESEKQSERFKIFDERRFEKCIMKSENETNLNLEKQGLSLGSMLTSYRNLRENYEFRLRYEEAGQFFIREMEMRRVYREKFSTSEKKDIPKENNWFIQKFSLTGLYYHLSRYGESISRPIILGVIIVGLSTLFWLIQNNPTGEPFIPNISNNKLDIAKTSVDNFINYSQISNNTHILKAFERSLADFLPLLSMPSDTKIGIIDFIVKIVGGGLTFVLLGVALRRKFERKYTR